MLSRYCFDIFMMFCSVKWLKMGAWTPSDEPSELAMFLAAGGPRARGGGVYWANGFCPCIIYI